MKQCPKCLNEHDKTGRFCSRSCANSRTFSEETIRLKSEAAYKFMATPRGPFAAEQRVASRRGVPRTSETIQAMVSTRRDNTALRFTRGEVTERRVLRRLLAEQAGYLCAVCSISKWNDQPITLQVDHIDGNPSNNNPENLRLLCPNCHSQTSTWGGRNRGSGRKARGLKTN